MANRAFDLIIFGVTGYTGVWCLRNMITLKTDDSKKYRFAVAGRNRSKIETVLERVGKEYGRDLVREITIIEADVANHESLTSMTSKCQVLVNAVGPYIKYGIPVVKACIETSTHHVDLSGEPQYLERAAVELFDEAREKGVYVVQCCGYDSIVADCGVMYLKDKNPDIRFNHVESFLNDRDPSNRPMNHGTFDSLICSIVGRREMKSLFTRSTNKFCTHPYRPHQPLKQVLWPRKGPFLNRWTMPLWPTDRHIVRRTQLMSYAQDPHDYPIQLQPYMYISNLIVYFAIVTMMPILALFSLFAPTRRLLHEYPQVFTFGKFTKDGPTDEQVRLASFEQYLVGKGWHKNQLDGQEPEIKPNVTKIVRVSGPEVGYAATSIMILCSAITILEDLQNQSDIKPGVFTPGFAFRKTKLLERLNRNGVEFCQIDVQN